MTFSSKFQFSSNISITSAQNGSAIIMKFESIYSFAKSALNLLAKTCSHFCIGILNVEFPFNSLMVTPF